MQTLYSVLIVNYNTAYFTRKAVESIIANATVENYTVQIVDNGSLDVDLKVLNEIKHPKVFILKLPRNYGFAVGYNVAARVSFKRDVPSYFVIMNPDVELIQPGTIECLIDEIRKNNSAVIGSQPLIWDYRFVKSAETQLAIRRVPDYWDLILCENVFLRFVFRKRFRKFTMADVQLGESNIIFQVPSGAFFVIDAQVFMDIGGFDENTFLYGEEFILGKKLQLRKFNFILVPTLKVKHWQGASTRFEYRKPNREMYNHRVNSHIYYARRYLGAGYFKILFLRIISEVNFMSFWIFKIIVSIFHKLVSNLVKLK